MAVLETQELWGGAVHFFRFSSVFICYEIATSVNDNSLDLIVTCCISGPSSVDVLVRHPRALSGMSQSLE